MAQARVAWTKAAILLVAALAGCAISPRARFASDADARPAASAAAGPTLYRISDADSTLWILAAAPTGAPDKRWLRPEIEAALAGADMVFLTVGAAGETLNQGEALVREMGMNPPGVALSARLSSMGRVRLQQSCAVLRVPSITLEPLRPWLALQVLDNRRTQATGARAGAVAVWAEAAARARGKSPLSLDSAPARLRTYSGLSAEAEDALLEAWLMETVEDPTILGRIEAAWLAGDDKALAELERRRFLGAPDAYAALVRGRSQTFADALEGLLRGKGTAFVVLDSLYAAGSDGVPKILEARGWGLERR